MRRIPDPQKPNTDEQVVIWIFVRTLKLSTIRIRAVALMSGGAKLLYLHQNRNRDFGVQISCQTNNKGCPRYRCLGQSEVVQGSRNTVARGRKADVSL